MDTLGDKNSERSAGVGICVRNGIGLGWFKEAHNGVKQPVKTVYGCRSIAARLDIPGTATLTIVCSYFHDGHKIGDEPNQEIMQWNSTVIKRQGFPAVVAADFNNIPLDPDLQRWCGEHNLVVSVCG